ncbi:MAG TPA: hypothetical protein VFG90_00965 [Nitrososphaeraceae archaeon]|nr:hypothetical protein [Nitrososphaeraceae archaeon]
MGKYITELIVEGKLPLDELPESYLFLIDDTLNRLLKAINIVATEKGYRVVSHSVDAFTKNNINLNGIMSYADIS